ncbi:hypothetical protein [Methylorubrum podarium]|jgi:hypothetical protein|uniref:hypothetical protein n=1 Tax=Methylorubrum podarium TaxID=200476 RepID=UPI001EE1994D|nr:hypothetical protein [Methylorubrum podarium]GJE70714.1 hypothetical protein CHKEEEPN_2254 [Methylorubrum podarium]
MTSSLRLGLAALAALGAVTAQAPAQTFTLPEIGLQGSGSCRQLAVRERDTQTMVPVGCIDTTSKKWTLSPEKLISDSVVAAGVCDTSQWTGYVGGTYSPQLHCYASKQSAKADIPFPAVVGIGPENFLDSKLPVNDQTYIQLAQNSIQIGGPHLVGVNTTLGSMPYAMLTGGGQRVCLNALSACMAYDTTNNLLRLNDNRLLITNSGIITASVQASGTSFLDLGNSRGQALRLLDAGGALANYVTLQGNSAGFGPVLRAAGSDANVPLNLSGQGNSPVQVLGGLAVTGGISAPSLPTAGGSVKGTVCADTAGNIYVKTTAGSCI